MKTRKSLAYPGHNIRIFCEWYKNIMKNYNTVKESNLLIKIKYEKFINDYDNQSKKLCKFLSIKKLSKFDYNINISKKKLI